MIKYAWLTTVYSSKVIIKEFQKVVFAVVIFNIVSLKLLDVG
jgi:hypothetical protein